MRSRYRNLLITLLLLPLSGCASVPLVHHLNPGTDQIKLGEKAFANENYEEADKIFSEIYSGDGSKDTKNSALYYLASTRIITAKDTNEFIAAVNLLEDWQASYAKIMYTEHPDILKKALVVGSKNITEQQHSLDDVVSSQKKQIAELKQHVETLQHQITELEAIDQQLQEKRQPL